MPAVVVGGGITGLTAAYELHKRGVPVRVLEASSRIGGLIETVHADGFTIEAGPDSLLAQKPAAIELCRELGLGGELQGLRTLGAFVLRGRTLYPLPRPSLLGLPIGWRSLARYSLLPPLARLRLALEPLVRARHSDADESVAAFFRRRFGAATVDLIAQPLLGGIHAGDIRQLSMQALFPRLIDIERRHRHVLTLFPREAEPQPGTRHVALATTGVPLDRSPFVALANGMSSLVQALEQRLGGAILCNAPARVLRREADRWVVEAGGVDGPIAARAVILAAPAFVAADLLAPIDAEAARICAEVEYVSTASVALAWRKSDVPHPLQGTGFVVARRHSDVRITACTWVSSKWAQRAPEGMALLRVFLGGAHDPAVVDLNDEAIAGIARRDLETTLGITAPPALARVFRWRRAGAQHTVGQPARSDALDRALARHTGLFVAGSGFRSVGIPDCIAEARAVAARAYTMWP